MTYDEERRLVLVVHATFCPICRIRVRRVEAGDAPDLRGGTEASTLYLDKPEAWVLCDEGRGLLRRCCGE